MMASQERKHKKIVDPHLSANTGNIIVLLSFYQIQENSLKTSSQPNGRQK